MLLLNQQFKKQQLANGGAIFLRPKIADNSAYLPNRPIWGYTPDGNSLGINTRFERRLSGFVDDEHGGNCGIVLDMTQPALGGGPSWKVWMNLANNGAYRAEFEAIENAWQPHYRIKTNIAVPIDLTMHTCFTVSRPTNHVAGTTTNPNTLQEDGPQHLLMQVHPHDDNLAGDGDQALDVTPWDALAMGNTSLSIYTKGPSATFGTPVWPRTTLIDDINTPFAQGKRLRILYRARFTKSADGFTEVYTKWVDPVNRIIEPWVLRYTYFGATMHPDNINYNPYTRIGDYAFDNQSWGDISAADGAGIERNGIRRFELYYEDMIWGDETNDPRYAGMSISDILERNGYQLTT
ncbi:MAG: hypothetical protein AAFR59_03220 [Bacteroidota bacterium]